MKEHVNENMKSFSTRLILQLLIFQASPAFTVASQGIRYVADGFKAPNAGTPSLLADEWRKADQTLWDYVNKSVPAVLEHTGSAAFDEHLKGVQAVLRHWGAPTYLASAGLFHSIYGTEGFQGFALPLSERSAIQNLIGKHAEQLCFWFCMVDRSTLDETVMAWEPDNDVIQEYRLRARPELGRFDLILNKKEWLDFIELTLADWLEQVEGAATKPSAIFHWKTGEAYAYRRLAYQKMAQILAVEKAPRLATLPQQMYDQVMATESSSTRHLVQPRTPPVSAEAARALEALRANGNKDIYIPDNWAPQPLSTISEDKKEETVCDTESA